MRRVPVLNRERDTGLHPIQPSQPKSLPNTTRRTSMNALFAPGAKRTRFLVAFSLTLLLAAPVALIWANRTLTISTADDAQSTMFAAQDREENNRLAAMGQIQPFYP